MNNNAIELEHVSKTFKIYQEKQDNLGDRIANPFKKDRFYSLPVLNDASLTIKKGEMFGIIGRNGTGKTTLLRLIAKIYKPDSGIIRSFGTIIPLLDLGIGFNNELPLKTQLRRVPPPFMPPPTSPVLPRKRQLISVALPAYPMSELSRNTQSTNVV